MTGPERIHPGKLRNRIMALDMAIEMLNRSRLPRGVGSWPSVAVLAEMRDELRAALARTGEG